MRMDAEGATAAELVNTADERELARIIATYGEERHAARIARAIVAARPLSRTGELAEIVRRAVPRAHDGLDPATRTFQALRVAVNDEIGELDRGLAAAERALAPGGVLVVVSFHSLEDRAVKSFLKTRSGDAPQTSRHLPSEDRRGAAPSFEILTKKPVRPREEECARNPRARSARLRAGRRTAAPPWPSSGRTVPTRSP
jgi:16S rRNA (cytosine1402-N4)-methyltransferase